MKKLLVAFGLLVGLSGASWAANNPIYGVVQITTSTTMTPPLQGGSFNVSSGTVQNFTINSSTASSFNATVSSITTLSVQNFIVNQATATSFNATVSSITTVTAQTFTAVTSTSTRINSTTIVVATITPTAVVGTTTNDSANPGNYGQYLSSAAASATVPPSGTAADMVSIALTAGDWDVSYIYNLNNGAAVTEADFWISQTAGNSNAGQVTGDNGTVNKGATNINSFGASVPSYRQSLSGNQTVYGKVLLTYTSTAPTMSGRISARRVR